MVQLINVMFVLNWMQLSQLVLDTFVSSVMLSLMLQVNLKNIVWIHIKFYEFLIAM